MKQTLKHPSPTEGEATVVKRKRVRLAPDVRSQKILDSALVEFSQRGFVATRIEDIARGAGLRKSGIYAHYASKEEIFESLLTRALVPVAVVPFDKSDSPAEFVDRFIDWLYTRLLQPEHQAMLRMLLAEAGRVPEVLRKWRREAITPVLDAQIDVLQQAVARGQLVRTSLTEDLSIAYAPVLYWTVLNLLPAEDGEVRRTLEMQRAAHREMMLALLRSP